jgi:uncharacterized protein (DUF2225 family)
MTGRELLQICNASDKDANFICMKTKKYITSLMSSEEFLLNKKFTCPVCNDIFHFDKEHITHDKEHITHREWVL